ncbi:hypothetical protein BGZ63DRAFT_403769 [Mariannaea sp. PMI_226]|nr:hypothetical protein BGZ63DRAFT_403769 [Mariannaea sp. PMI_226]
MLPHPASSLRSPLVRLRASIPAARPSAQVLLRCREHSRRALHEDIKRKNHYERLGVRHDATPAEIKKSFYSLSKTHHPDTNPSDPQAAHVFSLFSESYTILSDSSRRAAYDRDVLRVHQYQHHGHANPHASYHSTNPAGGRSPSGLSRRRGTFRGPPPSFYRSGGWGDQAEKRRKAHDESTGGGAEAAARSGARPKADPFAYRHDQHDQQQQQHHHRGRHGGMGIGEDPFGHQEEVPHFDKQGHHRTHTREDHRRWQRQRRAMGDDNIEFEPQTSMAGHFFIISGILVASIMAPLAYLQIMRLGRSSSKEKS